MNKLTTTLFILMTSLLGWSQMSEGKISYNIDITSDDPQMEMMIAMFDGSTMTSYFKDKKVRLEMDMGMVKNTTITDSDKQKSLMLMEGMMGSKAMVTDLDSTTVEETEDPMEDFSVEYIDEEKEIIGYTCNKAILTDSEGNELIYWYTEDIAPSTKMNTKIKGVPLEYEAIQGPMIMKFTATEFKDSIGEVDEDFFSVEIPIGYDEITIDELKAMSGGM